MSRIPGAGFQDGQRLDDFGPLALPFPDLPRMELEKLLGEVAARAQDVLATQGRLRALLRAHAMVASDLSLQVVLQHIVTAASELVESRYAALGVIGEHGLLDEFVHTGMDAEVIDRIGELPQGRGILGLLTRRPEPIRLTDLNSHPDAAGFPPGHPPMDSFLGVPIRIRDRIFGNLYLTGSANGEFSDEDEQLAVALAATAGVAIDNARRFDESEQRRRWLAASTEITQRLFAGNDEHPLDMVLRHAQDGASADFATLALLSESGRLEVTAAIGVLAGCVLGTGVELDGSLAGQVVRSGVPSLTDDYAAAGFADLPVPIGSVVVVPLSAGEHAIGALSVARLAGRRGLTEADMAHLAGFASHAGVAIELQRARVEKQAVRIVDEHDRIGSSLNEHVSGKLHAVATGLQGLASASTRPAVRDRLKSYIAVLDDTIGRIQSTVYDFDPRSQKTENLGERLMTVIDTASSVLGFEVETSFTGSLAAVPLGVTDDAVAIVEDALSAITRQADATAVEIQISILSELLTLDVVDNGVTMAAAGCPATPASNGCRSGAGTLGRSTGADGSTHLTWTVPVPRREGEDRPLAVGVAVALGNGCGRSGSGGVAAG
ncbi:GAF domain-containing protein [Amycolatopsis sp. NPDC024027]|uniref:GAF domain-containing protein n=1 Tax=Amycolatopsis sp. NPDC024027 TaxID=3154327 RepID=UPI0034049F0F